MNTDLKRQNQPSHANPPTPKGAGQSGAGHDADKDGSDPKVQTAAIRQAMTDLIAHLRRDIERVAEPKARVLFETSAEVLLGLIKAYDDYDAAKETAFRK